MAVGLQLESNFSLQYSNSIPPLVLMVINDKPEYAKITEIIIPVIFNKPIISVSILTTIPVGKVWEYGGKLRQVALTALGDSIVDEHPLSLIERNLIIYKSITSNYKLRYKPPKWFISVSIGVYQYELDEV